MLKKKPFLSIVIPAFNAEHSLPKLLESIFKSGEKNFEVIVVDDASLDKTGEVAGAFPVIYLKMKKNSGPARARNYGVSKASGEIILFLDSDVVLFPKTLKRVIELFKNDSQMIAVTGVWDKKQKNNRFFARFKALRDWSYWIHERDGDGAYFLFSPRIAAVRKPIFLKLGGFNTNYKGADVEDIELTYRVAKKYPILFDEQMKVSHEFDGFSSIARNYFRRSSMWMELFLGRLKFDPVATTKYEALIAVVAASSLLFLGMSFVSRIFLGIALVLLVIHIFLIRRFLSFVFSEEGYTFALKSLFTGYLLYLIICAGAFSGVVAFYIRKASK